MLVYFLPNYWLEMFSYFHQGIILQGTITLVLICGCFERPQNGNGMQWTSFRLFFLDEFFKHLLMRCQSFLQKHSLVNTLASSNLSCFYLACFWYFLSLLCFHLFFFLTECDPGDGFDLIRISRISWFKGHSARFFVGKILKAKASKHEKTPFFQKLTIPLHFFPADKLG